YPALFLSSFQPGTILKGGLKSGAQKALAKRTLLVIQFAVAILLIISTTVVYKQLEYIRNKNLGYDKNYIVYIPLLDNLSKEYEAIKTELLKYSDIKGVTASSQLPVYFGNFTMSVDWETKGADESFLINTSFVDYNFIDIFNIQLVQGRNFSKEYSTDQGYAYLVNEAAVKKMGLKSPAGKRFSIWNREGVIIGVVKDFHFRSLHKEIEPLALMVMPGDYDYLFAKINSGHIFNTVQFIKKIWRKFAPDEPFQYAFLDETIDRLYRSEQQTGRMMTYFAALALFISCLGLFGLVSYMAQTRTKEIGVRKVLGTSVANITKLLTADFTKWILISNLIAWPIAWYVMNKWLQSFAYRINVSWWIFVLAGGLALVIALLTVSYQAIKTATANPLEALRYE
ncbi:MAG: ABC transporter permease, partial [bacterium]